MDRRHLLKLVGAGGCSVAAQPLLWCAAGEPSAKEAAAPKHPVALFDVDSRELNKAGDGLDFRPRAEPLKDRLNRLYALSEKRRIPLVFTTCCSGRMLSPDSLPEVVVVPLAADRREWEAQMPSHRIFYLEKRAYSKPKENFTLRAYDMFQNNGNGARLVQSLNVGEWIVFGNGFDLCINSAVHGLLAAGQKVCLLSDVYARGSRGYYVPTPKGPFECGTQANLVRILAEFKQLGVRTVTLEQFLASV